MLVAQTYANCSEQTSEPSIRDIARVACKVIIEQSSKSESEDLLMWLQNLPLLTILCEYTGDNVRTSKVSWIFTTFGHWFVW